jgi:glycosyltransferase involved in cell wall biosynthesis
MKIGINISWVTPGAAGGMEWYVRCLVSELAKLDRDNDYLLVTAPNNQHTFTAPGPRWEKVVYCGAENAPEVYRGLPAVPRPARRWYTPLSRVYRRWQQARKGEWHGKFAALLASRRVDVWFCPFMYALPVDTDVPVVNTIPDLQHEHYPQFFHEHDLTLRHLGYQYSCKAAAATIGISRFVAGEITRLYDVPAERVFAIPLALDPSIEALRDRAGGLADQVRAKFRLDREFLYYPANGWPHKNHVTLVRAMARVARERPGLQLVMTGCPFDLPDRLKPLFDEHGLHDAVRHIGYVTREEVAGLYAASRMLVFPSLFEGFGLPLLEAMHLGAPVACSNIGSLPEVGGDSVLFFDPLAPEQIADAILRVTGDEALRLRLIAAGHEQVGRFNYARTAAATLDVFRGVHAGALARPPQPPFVPLSPRGVLRGGRARWYFRLRDLQRLKLRVEPPPGQPVSQFVEVYLDGRRVLGSPLDPRGSGDFLVAPALAEGEFHALEVAVSTAAQEPVPARVPHIVAVDSANRELRLVA